MTGEAVLFFAMLGLVAGALAARLLKAHPWQGAVEIVTGMLVALMVAAFLASTNPLLLLVAQMIGSGIAGGVMKLKGNQIAGIFVSAVLAQALAYLLYSSVSQGWS